MILLTDRSLFHIHTYRCEHAKNVPDEVYIRKAVNMGADSIWFSDHAPFPGDPFGKVMSLCRLPHKKLLKFRPGMTTHAVSG